MKSTARVQCRFTTISYIAYKYDIYTICGTKILYKAFSGHWVSEGTRGHEGHRARGRENQREATFWYL